MKVNFKEVIVINDQPVTCPKSGVRTDILLDLSHVNGQPQIHKCLNDMCSHLFVVEED